MCRKVYRSVYPRVHHPFQGCRVCLHQLVLRRHKVHLHRRGNQGRCRWLDRGSRFQFQQRKLSRNGALFLTTHLINRHLSLGPHQSSHRSLLPRWTSQGWESVVLTQLRALGWSRLVSDFVPKTLRLRLCARLESSHIDRVCILQQLLVTLYQIVLKIHQFLLHSCICLFRYTQWWSVLLKTGNLKNIIHIN